MTVNNDINLPDVNILQVKTNSNTILPGAADFLVVENLPSHEQISELENNTVIFEYDSQNTERIFGASAFEVAKQTGSPEAQGTQSEWISSLKGGNAFSVAQSTGFQGTESQWLESLQGEQGIQGVQGEQGIPGLNGADELTAAQTAISLGFQGTEEQYNELLMNIGDLNAVLEKIAVEEA